MKNKPYNPATHAVISKDLHYKLEFLGIIDESGIRNSHVGKSDYSGQLIQPWTIWLAYPELTSWDHDIIKRTVRTKDEGGMSATEARILDYEKIKHDCDERIRQLKLLLD